MNTNPTGRHTMLTLRALLSALLLLFAGLAAAAQPASKLTLDIPTPYLPSTTVAVEELLRLADVKPDDVVVDLGSGDGRIVITAAAAFGARGFGVDIDPKLVAEASENARRAGVSDRVRFMEQDVLKTDVREASVVTLYLLPGLVNRLKPKLLAELKPGTRIVAHDFGFADWKPDRTVSISKQYYLYVVPARVAGKWKLETEAGGTPRTYELEVRQDHQAIGGGGRSEGGYLPLFEPQLDGDRIRFALVDGGQAQHYEGRVRGSLMEGTVRSGIGRTAVERRWRAERVGPNAE